VIEKKCYIFLTESICIYAILLKEMSVGKNRK
jgi:hypothetical protein